MDTELARTFLTVITAGNFNNAAEHLHVTQSTVSARIQSLEAQLGCRLFVRNKAGTVLTAEGRHFQKHAATLVRTVEQARYEVGVPRGFRAAMTVGGRFAMWESVLLRWMPLMRRAMPDVSVRTEVGFEADLMQRLIDGRIDIGVMYTPQNRPGLVVEPLVDERLVMVSTSADAPPRPGPDYVYIDWGPEFYAQHSASFPDFTGPGLSANIGWLGLRHILANDGSAYFPLSFIRDHIDAGELVRVAQAPEFPLPAYVVYAEASDDELIGPALAIMRRLAGGDSTHRG